MPLPGPGCFAGGAGGSLYEQNDLEQAGRTARTGLEPTMDRSGYRELIAYSCLCKRGCFRQRTGQTGDAIRGSAGRTDSLRRSDALDLLKEIQFFGWRFTWPKKGDWQRPGALLPDPLAMGERLPGLSIDPDSSTRRMRRSCCGRAEATLAFAAQCETTRAGAAAGAGRWKPCCSRRLAQAKLGKRTAGSLPHKKPGAGPIEGYLPSLPGWWRGRADLLVGLYSYPDRPGPAQFARRILEAFPRRAAKTAAAAPPGLVEPLTEREVQVLEAALVGLSNQAVPTSWLFPTRPSKPTPVTFSRSWGLKIA